MVSQKYWYKSAFMKTRHACTLVALAGLLALSACSTPPAETAPSTTAASSTPRSEATANPLTTPITSDVVVTSVSATAVQSIPPTTEAPTPAAPVVVECLQGTPGPARMSDGTMAFSQWCFDQLGGNKYLESERQANTFNCDGTVCRNPYTGGSYPDPNATVPVTTVRTATPAEVIQNQQGVAESGCSTSGCIQTYFGCRDGYITGEVCSRWGF